MFRRRARREADETELDETPDAELEETLDEDDDDEGVVEESPRIGKERPSGPWDIEDVTDPAEGRVDLGGVLVPAIEGMELRVEVAQDQVIAATVVLNQSAVQVQAFAAPRSEGIWEDVRQEIAGEVTRQGGVIDEGTGPFGTELIAQVPVRLPDGNNGVQVVRFIGCDGPRWFLRGVISGQAAVARETAGPVEHVFRETVVVRGAQAMAPRDPIPLRFPPQMQQGEQQEEAQQGRFGDGLNPFQRGPEITEVR